MKEPFAPRTTRIGAALVALAAAMIVVVAFAVSDSPNSATAGPAGPSERLRCEDAQTVAVIIDYGTTARATATREELAARWAKGMSLDARYSRVDRVTVNRSEQHAEIAFTSGEERVIAPL